MATEILDEMLRDSLSPNPSKNTTWRNDPKNFNKSIKQDFEPGCIDFSPSWFAAAHSVII